MALGIYYTKIPMYPTFYPLTGDYKFVAPQHKDTWFVKCTIAPVICMNATVVSCKGVFVSTVSFFGGPLAEAA